MGREDRRGKRKSRDSYTKTRVPKLGYYYIVTDTDQTEKNYLEGLRDSIPEELRGKIVIKVTKSFFDIAYNRVFNTILDLYL